jgi:uncharacterized membrane protein YphA (DoxX/SURF4 family)
MAQPLNTGAVGISTARQRAIVEAHPARQAYQILYFAFVIEPIAAGLDKFFHLLVNWDMYLAPVIPQMFNTNAHTFMLVVGAIEIVAGLIVAFKPRIGAYIVALWLAGIIANLLIHPNRFYDIAARDFGLCLAALALGRLSEEFDRRR